LDGGDESLLGFSEISVTDSNHPYVAPWWPQGHNLGWEHAHIIEKFHFLEAVANGKPLSPYQATFEDGYRAAVIIAAMRQSSRSGQRIEISY
jgi:predicted dehydrogenase